MSQTLRSGGLVISKGNHAVYSNTGIFNLPAGTQYGVCQVDCPKCYAKKAQYRPAVLAARLNNLEFSRWYDFVDRMVKLITRANVPYFRIHESGDFYSKEYSDKWSEIARQLPKVTFFCYTKSPYRPQGSNVNVVESILPDGSINYGDDNFVEYWRAQGYPVCPKVKNKSIKCMRDCTTCLTAKYVIFHQH